MGTSREKGWRAVATLLYIFIAFYFSQHVARELSLKETHTSNSTRFVTFETPIRLPLVTY